MDIRPLLASTDDCYFAMPNTGDNAEVIFPVPPSSIGTERTLFLKASGYYDIHMGALGEPQHDTLIKIRREPGYAARYAWGEYLQWQKRKTGGESALDVGSLPETLTRMIGGFPAIPVLVRRTAGLLGYWLRKRKFPFFRLSARKGGYLQTRRISRELKLNKFARLGSRYFFFLSLPAWPSKAYDRMAGQGGLNYAAAGSALKQHIDTAILAVTRRCSRLPPLL